MKHKLLQEAQLSPIDHVMLYVSYTLSTASQILQNTNSRKQFKFHLKTWLFERAYM